MICLALRDALKFLVILVFTSIATLSSTSSYGVSESNIVWARSAGPLPDISNGGVLDLAMDSIGRVIVVGSFTVNGRMVARVTLAGEWDPGFDPPLFDQPVHSIDVQDDNLVLAGQFIEVNGQTARIVRLNSGGEVLALARPQISTSGQYTIRSVLGLTDHKILIGGDFGASLPLPQQYRRLVRVDTNGVVDQGFNAGINALTPTSVEVLVRQSDGLILAGGNFARSHEFPPELPPNDPVCQVANPPPSCVSTTVDYSRLARFGESGELDTTFRPLVANGSVQAIARQIDGKYIIGGTFLEVGGQNQAYLARVDAGGSLDSNFHPSVISNSRGISALAVQSDGKILVGGRFSSVNGQPAQQIARLNADGSTDTSFVAGTNGDWGVRAILLQANGRIIIGGDFTSVNGQQKGRLARLLADGSLDTTYEPVGPVLDVYPTLLNFGTVRTDEVSGPLTATLVSAGDSPVQITSIDGASSPFERVGGNCPAAVEPFSLNPQESCTIDYRFTPIEEGEASQLVQVISNAGSANIVLRGTGVTTAPQIQLTPTKIDSSLGQGGTTSTPLLISNVGGSPLAWSIQSHTAANNSTQFGPGVRSPAGTQELTHLVSRASGEAGEKANSASTLDQALSANGRFVAFVSVATNIHPDKTDSLGDVFVRDMETYETILVSRASGESGLKGNGHSGAVSISDDGRYVSFFSQSTNLSPDDTDAVRDIYVRDLVTYETVLVSRASGVTGAKANAVSELPRISANGRYIAFESRATNLHPDDPSGSGASASDIYVRDLLLHETHLASRASGPTGPVSSSASTQPSISANGRYVAFSSTATNLHPDDLDGGAAGQDVFVRDMIANETFFISRASGVGGENSNERCFEPSISADGRYVAFTSRANNLHPDDTDGVTAADDDVYVRDLLTHETMLVSYSHDGDGSGNPSSITPVISATGRYVAFRSTAINLHPDDTDGQSDVFLRDLSTNQTVLISRAGGVDGNKGNSSSFVGQSISVSSDNITIPFVSTATNLHPDDTDNIRDAYVRSISIGESPVECEFLDWLSVFPLNGIVESGAHQHVDVIMDATGLDTGSYMGNLCVESNDPDFSLIVVPVLLTVVEPMPSLALAPGQLDFGAVSVGAVAEGQVATLINLGNVPAHISDVGVAIAPFSRSSGSCPSEPFSLPVNGSCTLEYMFSPVADGNYTQTLAVASNADLVFLDLMGTGVLPALSVTPTEIAFGEVMVGTTAGIQSVALSNDGTTAITVTIIDAAVAPFLRTGGTCQVAPFDLSSGESCTLEYVFAPTAAGDYVQNVAVVSNAFDPVSFTLSGIGVEPILSVSPSSLTFGEVEIGQSATPQALTLTSTGTASVTVAAIDAVAPPFSRTGGTCQATPFDLSPSQSCTLEFGFSPAAAGSFNQALAVASNAAPVFFELGGTGVKPPPLPPQIVVDPDLLLFSVPSGDSAGEALLIANQGETTLEWLVRSNNRWLPGSVLAPVRAPTLPVLSEQPSGEITGHFAMELGNAPAVYVPGDEVPRGGLGTPVSVTHSAQPDLLNPNNTVACGPKDQPLQTYANRFLRSFTLTDFGIDGTLAVSALRFGVNRQSVPADITVNLYTLEGEFIYENLTLLATTTVHLPVQAPTFRVVPITAVVPAGSTLVVEVAAPDLTGVSGRFLAGSNNAGETAPSYIVAPDCGMTEPTPYADFGFPNVHLVMSVQGVAADCEPPAWLSADPASGTVDGGEIGETQVTANAGDLDIGSYPALLCLESNDPAQPLLPLQVLLDVTENGDVIFRHGFEL